MLDKFSFMLGEYTVYMSGFVIINFLSIQPLQQEENEYSLVGMECFKRRMMYVVTLCCYLNIFLSTLL